MNTDTLAAKVPPDFVTALHLTQSELEDHLLLMAALKMFELGKISVGTAAELAKMSKSEFLDTCAKYRVSAFNYADGELAAELAADLETAEDALSR